MDVLKPRLKVLSTWSLLFPVLKSITHHRILSGVHQRHGHIVSGSFFNKQYLLVADPEAIEEVFTLEAKGLLNRDMFYQVKKTFFGDGIINSKTALWVKQRRILQPIFSKEMVKEWETIILDEANILKNQLNSRSTVNLSAHFRCLIQTLFIKILLGISIDSRAEREALNNAIEQIGTGLVPLMLAEIFDDKVKWLFPRVIQRFRASSAYVKTFIKTALPHIMANPGHNLVSKLIQARDDKNSDDVMPEALLQDEAVNLLFAGQVTTVNTLIWFFYFIGRHPDAHQKITAEIAHLKNEPLHSGALSQYRYTRAALNETLRLYPPTEAIVTQAIEDITIGGNPIAQGTIVFLSLYAVHHHPQFWSQPETFNPERFYSDAEERPKYAFFPWGGGLHNCLGRHLAELEMMIIIITILRDYRFKTQIDVKEALSITLKPDRDIIGNLSPLENRI